MNDFFDRVRFLAPFSVAMALALGGVAIFHHFGVYGGAMPVLVGVGAAMIAFAVIGFE